jgi:hypothetical protein
MFSPDCVTLWHGLAGQEWQEGQEGGGRKREGATASLKRGDVETRREKGD